MTLRSSSLIGNRTPAVHVSCVHDAALKFFAALGFGVRTEKCSVGLAFMSKKKLFQRVDRRRIFVVTSHERK